ncbi:MAG: ribosome recycling factor [Chloroflexi bacterium]|nr:ribosome recycling factor [Chloroflexota bacterium]
MIESVLSDCETRMKKAIEVLRKDLATVRTGRASPALVENLLVDYFGVSTPLNQLASITAPDARLIVIQPWDRTVIQAVEKAILKSDVGLTPVSDGTSIRLGIPSLTEERRRELSRLVGKKGEESKVAVRNVRRDGLERLRAMEKNKEISQDDERRAQGRLQKLTDSHIEQGEHVMQEKEKEVMAV